MKLDREPVFGHITLNHKSDHKSFDYNELSLDSNGLKPGKVVKENQNGHVHDLKDSKKDASHLVYLVNDGNEIASSKPDCFKKTDNVKSQKEDLADDFVAPFAKSSSEIALLEKDLDCYTDKSAIECELPEFQICYKENGYSSVKDICIDEGVNSQDKILFESGVDKKSLCTFVFPNQDMDKQINKEQTDIGIFGTNDLKSSAKDELNKEFVCASKELGPGVGTKIDTTDKIANDISQDKIFPEDVILMREMEAEKTQSRSHSWDGNAVMEVQMSSDNEDETTQTAIRGLDHTTQKLDNDNEEELTTTASDSAAEESKSSSTVNELSYSSKVEKRRITFDFNSSASVANSKEDQNGIPESLDTENTSPVDSSTTGTEIITREECPKNGTCKSDVTPNAVKDGTCGTPVVSAEAQNESEHTECSQSGILVCAETRSSGDDEITPSLTSRLQYIMAKEDNPESSSSGWRHSTDVPMVDDGLSCVQSVSGHFQYGVGESSFSAAGPMSGRINYSGPIPYSGSISLRSDSSTTSTRSFAFPILQSEWNSSPVRMAKADRRHFRKPRGWRQGLLCCRF